MRIPVISGLIDRRILVNYRVDADVLQNLLPQPFRPKLINNIGIAGICLIRLKHIRPSGFPGAVGVSSENAAHRIAVEWEEDGQSREGVYIPRRDTSSRLTLLLGGRVFPGIHHRASFDVNEHDDRYRIVINSDDRKTHVAVEAELASSLPEASVFGSIEAASVFFENGAVGYSPANSRELHGLELRSFNWKIQPLAVTRVESSFLDDQQVFPPGSVEFDCALLMRGIAHEWHARQSLQVA
jgi:Uncharacterized conserved protein (COG2071)